MKQSAYVLSYLFATLALIVFMLLTVLPIFYWISLIAIGCVLSIFAIAFRYIGGSFK